MTKKAKKNNPFSNGGNLRNLIVVISDLHLGANLDYAECVLNRTALIEILVQIKESKNVKELVIAGDLFDEWFVPASNDNYGAKDQAQFVDMIYAANHEVFKALHAIIHSKVSLVYVPGNHDLAITEENVRKVLPLMLQVRDKPGLGTYSPVGYPEIAIEHGHRYNFFCAPIEPHKEDHAHLEKNESILPPGYFFTRIAAESVCINLEKKRKEHIVSMEQSNKHSESQKLLFSYRKIWEWAINAFPVDYTFDDRFIKANLEGYSGGYAINDLVPIQRLYDGDLHVNLYNGIQDRWDQRQSYNQVPIHTSAAQAIELTVDAVETDNQAKLQYFMNPKSDKRVVIFGHTHIARIDSFISPNNQKYIYANSGTWIDENPGNPTNTFLVVTPRDYNASTHIEIDLYHYEKNKSKTQNVIKKLKNDSVIIKKNR